MASCAALGCRQQRYLALPTFSLQQREVLGGWVQVSLPSLPVSPPLVLHPLVGASAPFFWHQARAPAFCSPRVTRGAAASKSTGTLRPIVPQQGPCTPAQSQAQAKPGTTSWIPEHRVCAGCATPQAVKPQRHLQVLGSGFLTCSSSTEGRRLFLLVSEKER